MNKQVTSQQVMLEEAKDRLEAAKRKLKVSYLGQGRLSFNVKSQGSYVGPNGIVSVNFFAKSFDWISVKCDGW